MRCKAGCASHLGEPGVGHEDSCQAEGVKEHLSALRARCGCAQTMPFRRSAHFRARCECTRKLSCWLSVSCHREPLFKGQRRKALELELAPDTLDKKVGAAALGKTAVRVKGGNGLPGQNAASAKFLACLCCSFLLTFFLSKPREQGLTCSCVSR